MDRARQEKQYSLVDGDSVVSVNNGCASRSNAWQIASFGYEAMLLLAATILTYQSRDVIEEINESSFLAFMVYSHFVFLVLRLLVFVLMLQVMIPMALALRIVSLLVSMDTLVAILIYFGPKFYRVVTRPDSERPSLRGIHMSTKSRSGSTRSIPGLNLPPGKVPNLILRASTRLFGGMSIKACEDIPNQISRRSIPSPSSSLQNNESVTRSSGTQQAEKVFQGLSDSTSNGPKCFKSFLKNSCDQSSLQPMHEQALNEDKEVELKEKKPESILKNSVIGNLVPDFPVRSQKARNSISFEGYNEDLEEFLSEVYDKNDSMLEETTPLTSNEK